MVTRANTKLRVPPVSPPALLLRLEAAVVLLASLGLYALSGGNWGRFLLLFLLPDLTFAGYLLGKRWGGLIYNLAHSYALPVALGAAALIGGWMPGVSLALIWSAHIAMDRLLGYGLKYPSGFMDTHLGRV